MERPRLAVVGDSQQNLVHLEVADDDFFVLLRLGLLLRRLGLAVPRLTGGGLTGVDRNVRVDQGEGGRPGSAPIRGVFVTPESLRVFIAGFEQLPVPSARTALGLEQVRGPRVAALVRLRVRERFWRETLRAHRAQQDFPRLRLRLGPFPIRRSGSLRGGPPLGSRRRRRRRGDAPVPPAPLLPLLREAPGVRVVSF